MRNYPIVSQNLHIVLREQALRHLGLASVLHPLSPSHHTSFLCSSTRRRKGSVRTSRPKAVSGFTPARFCLFSARNPEISTHILFMNAQKSGNPHTHFSYAVSELRESPRILCLCGLRNLGIPTHILLMQSLSSVNPHEHIRPGREKAAL